MENGASLSVLKGMSPPLLAHYFPLKKVLKDPILGLIEKNGGEISFHVHFKLVINFLYKKCNEPILRLFVS